MNKGLRYREQVLDEAFFGEQMPWTAATGAFLVSLHWGEPEDDKGGFQNEMRYPGYAAVRIERSHKAWARTGNVMRNRAEARFALCQEGPSISATHWCIRPEGRDYVAYRGRLPAAMTIKPGIRPVIDPETIEIEER